MNAHVVLNGTTFEGEGELVAVADTGFDLGSITNVHPAFTGRVAKLVPFGRPGQDGRSRWPWHPRLRLGARQRELAVHGRRDPGHGARG